MSITIVGLGAGDISQISYIAIEELKSNKKIYLRTKNHPITELLNIEYESFDSYYDSCESFEEVYEKIANIILSSGEKEDIIYVVPGHPRVAEITVGKIETLANEKNIPVRVIASMSFIDAMYNYLGFDPSEGFRLINSFDIKRKDLDSDSNIIITQVYDRFIASNVKLVLMDYYLDEQEVWIVSSAGIKDKEYKKKIKIYELDALENEFDHLTSLFIPKSCSKKYKDIFDLLDLVEKSHLNEDIDFDENTDIDKLIDILGEKLYEVLNECDLGIKTGFFDFYEVCNVLYSKKFTKNIEV